MGVWGRGYFVLRVYVWNGCIIFSRFVFLVKDTDGNGRVF